MRILLHSVGKTGSTALAYRIKTALPDHMLFFEPVRLDEVPPRAPNVIVKFLNTAVPADLESYDRRVLLVRHPFDIIVSFSLFIAIGRVAFLADHLAQPYYRLMRQIEEGEAGVSFRSLWSCLQPLLGHRGSMLEGDLLRRNQLYERAGDLLHVYRYEDYCLGRLDGLAAYLGVDLTSDGLVPSKHGHIERSRSFGDWKNWFDRDDAAHFTSFADVRQYAANFDYDLTFDPAHPRRIDPANGSQYLRRIIDRRRMQRGIPRFDPDRPPDERGAERFIASISALDKGEKKLALEAAITSVEEAPDNIGYLNHLAWCYLVSNIPEPALSTARRAIALDSRQPFTWSLLAGCHSRLGATQAALAALDQVYALAPEDAVDQFHAVERAVEICKREGNWTLAETWLRRAIMAGRGETEHHGRLAMVLSGLGRPEEALAQIDVALAGDPASSAHHRLRAALLTELGRPEEALGSLDRALALDPNAVAAAPLPRADKVRQSVRRWLGRQPGLRRREGKR